MIPFAQKLTKPLSKERITVLQINLGKRCNLACSHCHVEAGPHRTEEFSEETLQNILSILKKFPQIETVDLTGGAPEMNFGFREIVKFASKLEKEVIVRSNLTIFFEEGFEDIPEFLAEHECHVVASLPCYREENVDKMRGNGVFQKSIEALRKLNSLGYGITSDLVLDLVYNPQLPTSERFSLSPQQQSLQEEYKKFLKEHFDIQFHSLLTITNIPIGRTRMYLQRKNLQNKYEEFLERNYNPQTVSKLMCKNELSIDYNGNVFDCDFHQMEGVHSLDTNGEKITLAKLLKEESLDIIPLIQTRNYCYGCTAGCGASCGGALV